MLQVLDWLLSMKRLAKAAETAKAEMNVIIDTMSLLFITNYIMNDYRGKGKIYFEKNYAGSSGFLLN